MAGGLMRLVPLLAALGGVGAQPLSAAQDLRDPTRPPAIARTAGAAGSIERSGWNLQSVLISPERRYAIINGTVVQLGGAIAGAELVAVAEASVTLRTREGLRVVHLFPRVSKLDAFRAVAAPENVTSSVGRISKTPRAAAVSIEESK